MAGILLCIGFLFNFPVCTNAQVVSTVAGNGYAGYSGDNGPATTATLDSPSCAVVDGHGNIYISDQLNNCIRSVNTSGIITTIAGTGIPGYNGDNIAATAAQLSSNWALAVDASDNVYVADQGNNRIRKIGPSGIITTIGGNGLPGFFGDGGPATAAMVNNPLGIAVDGSGNVYVGDANNRRVRRINTAGIISTVAGNGIGGYSGDGGVATAAQLQVLWGLATDAAGYVYVCDAWNSRVRKVDPAPGGLITTVAGNGYQGFDGDGGAATSARLNLPTGVYVNNDGEIFIADCRNNRVRKVSTGGIISTIAGNGTPGFSGDNGLAVNAALHGPLSVYGDGSGGIYIADVDNVRVRKISIVSLLSFAGGRNQAAGACRDASLSLDSILAVMDYTAGAWDTWSVVTAPLHGDLNASYEAASTGGRNVPSGLSYVPNAGYTGNDMFTIRVANATLADTTTISLSVAPVITTAGTITGLSSLCMGSAVTLSDDIGGGAWYCSNTNVQLVADDNKTLVTGIAEGMDTLLYVLSNGCNADTAIKVIGVLAAPDAGAISGQSTLCQGDTIVLTDAAPGGAWSAANAVISIYEGTVVGRHPGVSDALYIVSNAACADTAFYIVRIDSMPLPPVISGPGSVCVKAQVALDGGLILGTWSSDDMNLATIDPQTGIVMGLVPGTDSVRYTITNTCGSAMAAMNITVNALPAVPEIRRREALLWVQGDYTAYQWTISGTAVGGAVSDTFVATGSGAYGVIVTSAAGCSNASQPYNYPGCLPDDLYIYPNPTAGKLYIEWCDKTTARVAAADGKVIRIAENADDIDLSSLPEGVYMVTVYDRNGKMVKTKRITKLAK